MKKTFYSSLQKGDFIIKIYSMSEEHNVCHYYFIQSKNRRDEETATNFTVQNQKFNDSANIELSLIQIPYTFYPISNGMNQLIFEVQGAGSTVTATITPGNYSVSTFITELQTKMAAVAGGNTYTATISSITGKITITQNSGNFRIYGTTSSIAPIIGFSTLTSYSNAQTSNNLINLSGTDYLDIFSTTLTSFNTRNNDTAFSGSKRLARIPVKDYSFGQTISYKPHFHMINNVSTDETIIDIQMKDMYGNFVDLNGRDWFIKLKYHSDKPHKRTIRSGNLHNEFSRFEMVNGTLSNKN